MRYPRTFALLLAATSACGARVPHTHPEDMSAQAHRNEASHHLDQAEAAAQRIEQRDHRRFEEPEPHPQYWYSYSYQWDTERWIQEAEGIEHLAAAQALEHEYAFACALIPQAVQAISPIEVFIEGVERVDERAVVIHLGAAAGPPSSYCTICAVTVRAWRSSASTRCETARLACTGSWSRCAPSRPGWT